MNRPHDSEAVSNPFMRLKAYSYAASPKSTYLYDLSDTADTYEWSLDSLQAMAWVDEVKYFLHKWPNAAQTPAQTIYSNPSVEKLLATIKGSPHAGVGL